MEAAKKVIFIVALPPPSSLVATFFGGIFLKLKKWPGPYSPPHTTSGRASKKKSLFASQIKL